ncbi:uncharacterized protein V1516DRAFT_655984 [Lipomyces oligophaga]|uniref:uncharacterized protein n=1 Tax=Lipomyces oligophaga TaxID=45792 RepID=UPI0034CD9942
MAGQRRASKPKAVITKAEKEYSEESPLSSSSSEEEESEFEEMSANESGVESVIELSEAEEEEESNRKRRRTSGSSTDKRAPAKVKSSSKRKVSKDEDEFREHFIPHKKARGDGGIGYSPATIHPNTLEFLRELKQNNDREWFWDNEKEYRQAKKDFDDFVEVLAERVVDLDETVPPLPVKDLVFRVHRDVRFSNDKTPYKPYFSAAFSRTGRQGHYAHYYFHLEPGEIRMIGGMWHLSDCNNDGLAAMRRMIDRGAKRLKSILQEQTLRKYFFRDQSHTPLEQFLAMNQGDALKKGPKGYSKDHKDLKLLCLRSFTISTRLSDDNFKPGEKPVDKLAKLIAALRPFVNLLNDTAMDFIDSEVSDNDELDLDSSVKV